MRAVVAAAVFFGASASWLTVLAGVEPHAARPGAATVTSAMDATRPLSARMGPPPFPPTGTWRLSAENAGDVNACRGGVTDSGDRVHAGHGADDGGSRTEAEELPLHPHLP